MTYRNLVARIRTMVAFADMAGVKPVVHENGFIILNLGDGARLHVWPDGPIAKQATDSPLHDHRFGFESVVIAGTLEHIELEWRATHVNPSLQVFRVVDGKLEGTCEVGYAVVRDRMRLAPGSSYTFGPRRFHTSRGDGLTATVMRKTENHPELTPRVLAPVGQVPDNDFDREASNDEVELWRYINRAVLRAGLAS